MEMALHAKHFELAVVGRLAGSGWRLHPPEARLVWSLRRRCQDAHLEATQRGARPARLYRLTRETLTNILEAWAGVVTNIYDLIGNRTSCQAGFGFVPVDTCR